jgi:hypothetical protein
MRAAAALLLVTLAGCGAVPLPLVTAGIGLAAGEAKMATAFFDWLTVKDALPPICTAVPAPPCILEPAKP